jgi:transcriptional regulator with XRE-family HTH domain
MRLRTESIKNQCAEAGITLAELLDRAGVSRTAYYSLAHKESVVPKSIHRLARTLDVPVSKLLEDKEALRREMIQLAEKAHGIAAKYKGANEENIRHTLILLKHEPIERLRRALRRAS